MSRRRRTRGATRKQGVAHHRAIDKMAFMYSILRRALFRLDPETAHGLATRALDATAAAKQGARALNAAFAHHAPHLRQELWGLSFPNPVGIAAGFDKNGRHLPGLAAVGFGFLEVGSVSWSPSIGNPRPRLFRLPHDRALINRMGLNNEGALAVAARLATRPELGVPVFVNIAKSHDTSLKGAAAIEDYRRSMAALAPVADAIVLNISCPNAGDGRTFETPEALDALLGAVLPYADGKPVLIKVSPDLSQADLEAVVERAEFHQISGYTATNTTVRRVGLKTSASALEAIGPGGLSGAPLYDRAVATVRTLRHLTDRPIVGVGGIDSPLRAQQMRAAGAQLVQIYSGFVFEGPQLPGRICRAL